MLKVFYGDDRVRANAEIKKLLGENYEIVDGPDLVETDLPSVFFGTTLFADRRNILIRDLSENKPLFDKLPDYITTPHNIILLETKLDKRSAAYKTLKDQIEFTEFKLPPAQDFRLIFDIYKTARKNGPAAVKLLEKVKSAEDPIMFFGLMVSQALKDFTAHQGTKEAKNLKTLAEFDLKMKTTKVDPWLLVESCLLTLV